MFQLKKRLEQLKVSQPINSLNAQERPKNSRFLNEDLEVSASAKDFQLSTSSSDNNPVDEALEGTGVEEYDEDITVNKMGICDGKNELGNRPNVKAWFGCRWTHNEQLCVASCGVILGCATFYGSEAPNGVCVSSNSLCCKSIMLTWVCTRHSGGHYFQQKCLFRLFFGMTIIVRLLPC